MPLDALCLAAVREELADRITGMRIDKLQQPERDVLILSLRGREESCRLLISAGSQDARIHITEYPFENPSTPPMFCMLLRKHLTGARIVSLIQPPSERIVNIVLEARDALGILSEKHMIIEMIGRSSNIILTEAPQPGGQTVGDRGQGTGEIIIDCLRRVGSGDSEKRAVLPGMIYRMPPKQTGKIDPFEITSDKWQAAFGKSVDKTVEKWLLATFCALSPLICRELSWRAYGEADFQMRAIKDNGEALRREFFSLIETVKDRAFAPCLIIDSDDRPLDFSFTRVLQYESAMNVVSAESFSSMLDGFFSRTAALTRSRQRAAAMAKIVTNARDRLVRKLAAQREELLNSENRETLRQCGDIITANIHIMRKGQSELCAQDFFREDGATRSIRLDPTKTPQQNAARYYKDYTRAKNAEKILSEQVRIGENELTYLDSVVGEIQIAETESDFAAIRDELAQTGYVKQQRKAKEKHVESTPHRFVSSGGMQILAGRNNAQNDKLTLKTAAKSDVWLHVQKSHGAHVIIVCGGNQPDEASLNEAAAIAAYYSSARTGGKTAVDYTLVKNVKKPQGARPGMVVYTDYKTIITTPDEELVARLRRSRE